MQQMQAFPPQVNGSNCTFMELKFLSVLRLCQRSEVLIVPLWN